MPPLSHKIATELQFTCLLTCCLYPPGRSWSHLTGRQLDCLTCFTESAQDGSVEEAAHVSPVTATSADGGVRAASATAQSDAAKHDLGDDDDDADMGMYNLLDAAVLS